MRRSRKCARLAAILPVLLALCPDVYPFDIVTIDAGRGTVDLLVPDANTPTDPAALVLLLHGYSKTGDSQEAYMNFSSVVDEFGLLYAYPDGMVDPDGKQFWNATDACCNFFGSPVDDSGYLRGLIDLIGLSYALSDVYIVGHSNGGFMAHRMACDHSDRITAIASLAGATFLNPTDCGTPDPVHVLQIHGTGDFAIPYAGGCIDDNCYPGAVASVEQWATFGGCEMVPDTTAPDLNLVEGPPLDDTTVTRFANGCSEGGSATLWTIIDGIHSPDLVPDFSRQVMQFLFSVRAGDPLFADGFETGDTIGWSATSPP